VDVDNAQLADFVRIPQHEFRGSGADPENRGDGGIRAVDPAGSFPQANTLKALRQISFLAGLGCTHSPAQACDPLMARFHWRRIYGSMTRSVNRAMTQARNDSTPQSQSESRQVRALRGASRLETCAARLETCTATVITAPHAKNPKKKNLKFCKTKPLSPIGSANQPKKQAKTKPNEARKVKVWIGISLLESASRSKRWLRSTNSKPPGSDLASDLKRRL
jgi:hypothetical protein